MEYGFHLARYPAVEPRNLFHLYSKTVRTNLLAGYFAHIVECERDGTTAKFINKIDSVDMIRSCVDDKGTPRKCFTFLSYCQPFLCSC